MDLNKSSLHDSNYVEIYLINNNINNIVDTSINKDLFYKILNKFKSDNFKFFQKEYKQYTLSNIYYENYNNEDVKVTKKICNNVNISKKFMTVFYNKNKLTMLNLPSTVKVNDISYIQKLTFRINNRIYLNFQSKKNNNTIHYSIYINYNHDDNVDTNITNNIIKPILQKLDTTC
jgi:hypothetical protein